MSYKDEFGAKKTLSTQAGTVSYYDINVLEEQGVAQVSKLPFSIKIMLESLLRNVNGYDVTREDVINLAQWKPEPGEINVPLKLARVILQDFTGVPAVVDLAALRSAMARFGADPKKINPQVPVDLVIDHSVQVDYFGTQYAFFYNVDKEYERNRERYTLLKWGQQALDNFRVVPPGTGIVHQVNLEYLAQVVMTRTENGETVAFPDSLVGTDSHTTMINGLGVLGWGVGGIEAEAVMLGQPYYMLAPKVVGFKLTGELPEGATATDLVLRITEMLRQHGVVGKFVEFYGPGLAKLSLADRATIANMAPEYGATMGFFPVDEETLAYLRLTGRDEALVDLVERYTKAVGLFRTDDAEPVYSETLELDMSTVEPSLAGPKRPQDRVPLRQIKASFQEHLTKPATERGFGLKPEELGKKATVKRGQEEFELQHGSVVIAAITSCTNTSNPSVMLGAGLLAKKAVEAGLDVQPWVKTSMAPGSKVVRDYLEASGLMPFLEALRFHIVGYGCTTCIGNSGPLPKEIAEAVEREDLVVAAVLSGNRNFEGRINPHVKANYLASPMLVVAYAIAGRVDIDFETEPLGYDPNGRPVYLKDIWPSQAEIRDTIRRVLDPEMFKKEYASVFDGDERWQNLPAPSGDLYEWDENSTYIQEPPFFVDMPLEAPPLQDIKGARVLALLGDSVTTDHISPAGVIPADGPAGQYLIQKGVKPAEFNSFGSRRGNHEVMMRGTFANIRIKNLMLDGVEGGYTVKLPEGERMFIYDAAMKYKEEGTPLVVIGGKEYGTGSSRDWAAKGTYLLGVKAVIAESFERIHRSNLVGMGVLPLQFKPGESAKSLGLTGFETYDILGLNEDLKPGSELTVVAKKPDGTEVRFNVIVRLDTPVEVDYYKNGGILQTVLRRLLKEAKRAEA
ncbi:aconitate hydratase AcnA [Marinithermus hydrothermalis]|uniref:Aconitate hydratase n=1 Tax=Marinithermus hydrothermalis (strain DSM 14884 / JCM 11576 / T1) TaxID=869210 RepID=F2NMB2_MARHT|nr:aconitate hydratase AcnA [Marinithermus hydrothermalis]AEB11800.1 aconitate hydratase 1 [Marinithermus hydrothermalis DSM 14884]